jgi:N-acetylmuramoyl-L-alanine amidase
LAQLENLYTIGRNILRYRQLAIGIWVTIATSYGAPVIEQLQAQSLNKTNQANVIKSPLLLSPNNQIAQAIPIESNPTSPIPSATSNAVVIERLSFSSTGQLLIFANQPFNYQTRLDRTSGTFNITVLNAKISSNLQRPSLASNSPIERIRLSQVGKSVEIGIKTIPGWQIRETQRFTNQQIQLQVSLTSISPFPNNQNPLPNNNPNIPNPQNTGDRRRGVIFVDAGHGGNDPGAVGNGIQEKDVVLPISLKLGQALQSMGYTVYYTRTNDVEIDLEPRVAAAERINADVFVSVHANSLAPGNSGINGVETYHSRNSTVGRELASYVHSQIISGTGASDRSVRGAGFYVIARTSMPAILVETGYVTNPTEARNLNSPDYQKRMADAIARGIDQFMRVRGR